MNSGTAATLLTALQFGDGQFPSGGFAFSWGLESLIADGKLTRADFADFLDGQLRHRWATFDRILIAHAHAASGNPARLMELDDLTDAFLTVEASRAGSCRAGGALLGTHVRLGTPGAAALKGQLEHGHLSIVQGVVLAGVGLDEPSALMVGAYTMAQSLCTAAIRLGLIGHLDAQQALTRSRPAMAAFATAARPDLDALATFVPVTEIAMMRHGGQAQRLFSN